MRIIFVDDEEYMAIRFRMECESIPEVQLLGCFKSPLEAIDFARENYIEAAFLGIRMPEMTGLELSEKLRELYPDIVIVFISAHDKYMREALQDKGADYYIFKPYSSTDIASVIERTQLLMKKQAKRVSIETFGRFSVYVDGRYLEFKSKKAKEALAIIVDNRGTSVDTKMIWNTMFEEEYDHLLRGAGHRRWSGLRSGPVSQSRLLGRKYRYCQSCLQTSGDRRRRAGV